MRIYTGHARAVSTIKSRGAHGEFSLLLCVRTYACALKQREVYSQTHKMAYTPIGARQYLGFDSSPASLRLDSMTITARSSLPSIGGGGCGPQSSSGGGQLSSLARLDQQLSCAICLERYYEPRILKCSHSFCRRCLVQLLEQRADDPENPQRTSV